MIEILTSLYAQAFEPVTATPFQLLVFGLGIGAAIWVAASAYTLYRCADMRLQPLYDQAQRDLTSAVEALRELAIAYQRLLQATDNVPGGGLNDATTIVIADRRGVRTTVSIAPLLRARCVLQRHPAPARAAKADRAGTRQRRQA